MTLFENFVNLELPRRATYLDFAITAYDGDPNDVLAPTIVQGAPSGSLYSRLTGDLLYRKNARGFWELGGVRGNVTVYVDVAGDDDAAGDITRPVLTLDEANKRVKLFGANKIIMGAGNFEVPDYSNDPDGNKFVLHGTYPGLNVEGTLIDFLGQATVDITSWTGNIANVSDVLVPGALKGAFLSYATLGGSDRFRWVIDNDASTVTVAISTVNLGGFQNPVTGVRAVKSIGTKITANSVTPGFPNRFFVTGEVTLKYLDFDGAAVSGASSMAWVRSPLANVVFTNCRFTDWSQAVIGGGHMSWTTCWFEDCPTAVSAGNYNNWSADNVVIRASVVAILVGANVSSVNLGAVDTKWIEDCALFVSGRGGRTIQDFTPFAWIEGTLGTYVDFTGNMGNYLKGNIGMGFWPGKDAVINYVKTASGGSSVDFRDSANGTMPTGNWVNDNGVVISLADFNANLGASTGVRLYAGPRGTFWFD